MHSFIQTFIHDEIIGPRETGFATYCLRSHSKKLELKNIVFVESLYVDEIIIIVLELLYLVFCKVNILEKLLWEKSTVLIYLTHHLPIMKKS